MLKVWAGVWGVGVRVARYKAHFRWPHYTSPLLPGAGDQPEGTEACASVTSAFLQVLATMQRIESHRVDCPRNVLAILATNTRRTKVVELSSGTHRVADELRRHSLGDGQGGQYSTNLDRNRYGADNNYLFTVTRFNLECLGLCPCLVDIEIVDTRNGNESQLVSAGPAACSCASAARRELADGLRSPADGFAGAVSLGPAPHDGGSFSGGFYGASARRAASTSPLPRGKRSPSLGPPPEAHAPGLGRAPSAGALRRPASAQRERPEHSHATSGGSELFDALLMAATDDLEAGGGAQGDAQGPYRPAGGAGPEASSGARARGAERASRGFSSSAAQARRDSSPGRRSRPMAWNASFHEVDSLQHALDAFRGEEEGGGGGASSLARASSRGRRMLRRNSVSMIIENPVLAQTGAADSLLLGSYPALYALGGAPGSYDALPLLAERTHTSEGGAEAPGGAGEEEGGEHASFRQGLLRQLDKPASAASLSRLAGGGEAARLAEDLLAARDEAERLEAALAAAAQRESAAREALSRTAAELRETRATARKAALVLRRVRDRVVGVKRERGAEHPGAGSPSCPARAPLAPGTPSSPSRGEEGSLDLAPEALAGAAAGLLTEDDLGFVAAQFLAHEAELESLRAELAAARAALARAEAGPARDARRAAQGEGALARLRQASRSPSLVAARAASLGSPAAAPPPLFGAAPLNPLGGMLPSAFRAAAVPRALHKVASAPSLHRPPLSPCEPRAAKRAREEDVERGGERAAGLRTRDETPTPPPASPSPPPLAQPAEEEGSRASSVGRRAEDAEAGLVEDGVPDGGCPGLVAR